MIGLIWLWVSLNKQISLISMVCHRTLWSFTTHLVILFHLWSLIETPTSHSGSKRFSRTVTVVYYMMAAGIWSQSTMFQFQEMSRLLRSEYKQWKCYLNCDLSLNTVWLTTPWGPRPTSLWLPCLKVLRVVAVNLIQVSATNLGWCPVVHHRF